MYKYIGPNGWHPDDLESVRQIPIVQNIGRTPYEQLAPSDMRYIGSVGQASPIRLYVMAEIASSIEPPNTSVLAVIHSIAASRNLEVSNEIAVAEAQKGIRSRRAARRMLPRLNHGQRAYGMVEQFTLAALNPRFQFTARQQR